MVAAPWFARAGSGTSPLEPLAALAGRPKIGRGVWCETYWLPEADLVTLGDGATVNRGCVVQTHLFHDRIMRMDGSNSPTGATLGPHCVILPAASSARRHRRPGVAGDARRGRAGRAPAGPATRSRPGPTACHARDVDGRGGAERGDPTCRSSGNGGYRVTHYDLSWTTAALEPAGRHGAVLTATATAAAARVQPRPVGALRVDRVLSTAARAVRTPAHGKLRRHAGRRPRARLHDRGALRRRRPSRCGQPWGDVGWEELTDGVLVASQPNGAPSWFPCNDHPSARRPTDRRSPRKPLPGGGQRRAGVAAARAGSQPYWVYEQAEPMATYLATVQIGATSCWHLSAAAACSTRRCPPASCSDFEHDFARQPRDDGALRAVRAPTRSPAATPSSSPTTSWRSRSRPRACRSSAPTTCDGGLGQRAADRPRARAPVVRQQPDRADWRDIWLHEGFACYAEWLWSEASAAAPAPTSSPAAGTPGWPKPAGPVLRDPGPRTCSTTASTSAAPDPARAAAWVAAHRHGGVRTEDFVDLVRGDAAPVMSHPEQFFERWLGTAKLPPLPPG
jgi:hypothetical protein